MHVVPENQTDPEHSPGKQTRLSLTLSHDKKDQLKKIMHLITL